jgi:hypothetical protein
MRFPQKVAQQLSRDIAERAAETMRREAGYTGMARYKNLSQAMSLKKSRELHAALRKGFHEI